MWWAQLYFLENKDSQAPGVETVWSLPTRGERVARLRVHVSGVGSWGLLGKQWSVASRGLLGARACGQGTGVGLSSW